MAQASKQSNNKEGSNKQEMTPKTFMDYVTELKARIEKFKTTQQFVYCYMSERIDLAVELYNADRVKEAWHLYRKISAEVSELLGMYKQTRRTKYFFRRGK
jgi:hypothetical protein